MDLLFLSIEQVSIAIGAGSSFIFCTFFILSLKNHQIKPFEYTILRRLSLYSTVSASVALCTFIIRTSFYFESGLDVQIGIISLQIILLSIALLGEMTLRKIHLPTLMRHQTSYFHLSHSMGDHQDPLIATASFSIVSWLFIIFLGGIQFRELTTNILSPDSVFVSSSIRQSELSQFPFSFVSFLILYICMGYIAGKISIRFKERYTGKI